MSSSPEKSPLFRLASINGKNTNSNHDRYKPTLASRKAWRKSAIGSSGIGSIFSDTSHSPAIEVALDNDIYKQEYSVKSSYYHGSNASSSIVHNHRLPRLAIEILSNFQISVLLWLPVCVCIFSAFAYSAGLSRQTIPLESCTILPQSEIISAVTIACLSQKMDLNLPSPMLKSQFLRLGIHYPAADSSRIVKLHSLVSATINNITSQYEAVTNISEYREVATKAHLNASTPMTMLLSTVLFDSYSHIGLGDVSVAVTVSAIMNKSNFTLGVVDRTLVVSVLFSQYVGTVYMISLHLALCIAAFIVFSSLCLKDANRGNMVRWPYIIVANFAEQCLACIALLFLILALRPGRIYLTAIQLWGQWWGEEVGGILSSKSFLFFMEWSESAAIIGLMFSFYLVVDGLKYTPDPSVVRREMYGSRTKLWNEHTSGRDSGYTNNMYLWRSGSGIGKYGSRNTPSMTSDAAAPSSAEWFLSLPTTQNREGQESDPSVLSADDGSLADNMAVKSFIERVQSRFTPRAVGGKLEDTRTHPMSPPFTTIFMLQALGALTLSWALLGTYLYILVYKDALKIYHGVHYKTLRFVGSMCSAVVYGSWTLAIAQAFRSSGHVLKSISHMKSRLRQITYRVLYSQVFRCLISVKLSLIGVLIIQDYEDIKSQTSFVSKIFSVASATQKLHILSKFFQYFCGSWLIDVGRTCLTIFVSVFTLSVIVALMPIAARKQSRNQRDAHAAALSLSGFPPTDAPSYLSLASIAATPEAAAKQEEAHDHSHSNEFESGIETNELLFGSTHTYISLERMRTSRKKTTSHGAAADIKTKELFCLETACRLMEVAYQAYFAHGSPSVDSTVVGEVDAADDRGSEYARRISGTSTYGGPRIDLRPLGYHLHSVFESSSSSTFGLVGVSNGSVVVAFRGSVLANFMTDITITQVPFIDLRVSLDTLRTLVDIHLAARSEQGSQLNTAAFAVASEASLNPFSDEWTGESGNGVQDTSTSDSETSFLIHGGRNVPSGDADKKYGNQSSPLVCDPAGETSLGVDSGSRVLQVISSIPVVNNALPRVHKGFWEAYASIRNDFLGALVCSLLECVKRRREAMYTLLSPSSSALTDYVLSDDSASTRIYFSGHSLGASLSVLAATDVAANMGAIWRLVLEIDGTKSLMTTSPPVISVYTYGSPRVGNSSFVDYCNTLVPSIFRVELEGDIVTTLPRFFGLYRHVGLKVLVGAEKNGSILVQPTSMENYILCDEAYSLASHGLHAYRSSLEACFDEDELQEYLSMEEYNYFSIKQDTCRRESDPRLSAKLRFST